jgi:hypothetical protein
MILRAFLTLKPSGNFRQAEKRGDQGASVVGGIRGGRLATESLLKDPSKCCAHQQRSSHRSVWQAFDFVRPGDRVAEFE